MRKLLGLLWALAAVAGYGATPTVIGTPSPASCSTGNYAAEAGVDAVIVVGGISLTAAGSGDITDATFTGSTSGTASVSGGTAFFDKKVVTDGPANRLIAYVLRIPAANLPVGNISVSLTVSGTLSNSTEICEWFSMDTSAGTTLAVDVTGSKQQTTSSSTATDFQGSFTVSNNSFQFTSIETTSTGSSTPVSGYTEIRDGSLPGSNGQNIAIHTQSTTTGGSVTFGNGSVSTARAGSVAAVSYVESAASTPPVFSGPVADQSSTIDTAASSLDLSAYFSNSPTSYALSGCTLPHGLSLNTSSGVISGTPDHPLSVTGCIVTATNADGSDATNAFAWSITAAAGKQFTTLASVSSTSVCAGVSSPAIAASDITEFDTATTPDADAITVGTDCDVSYPSDGSRQYMCWRVYDASVVDWMTVSGTGICGAGYSSLWFNNHAPYLVDPSESIVVLAPLNSAMTDFDLAPLATDDDGDTLSITTGTLPTGLTLTSGSIGGTATVQGIYTVTATWTDIAGATVQAPVTIIVGDVTVPDCTSTPTTLGDCINDLQAVYLDAGTVTLSSSTTIPAGDVISQSQSAGSSVPAFSAVDLVVSKGVGARGFYYRAIVGPGPRP